MDFKDVLTSIALLGTGGALGSWISVWFRNRREDRLRWHNELRTACEKFLTGAEKMYDVELLIAEHFGNVRQLAGLDDEPRLDEGYVLRHAEKLDGDGASYSIDMVRRHRPLGTAAQEQMYDGLAAIEMISPSSVIERARDYSNSTKSFVAMAFTYPPRECGGWSPPLVEASDKVATAREAFLNATRDALGVQV